MNLLLSDLIWIFLIAAIAGIWWHGQGMKARALAHAKRYCQKHDLQFLDESLVLRKVTFRRGGSGFLEFVRIYAFEFTSTGEYRYRGTITLQGYRLADIDTQTHHLQ